MDRVSSRTKVGKTLDDIITTGNFGVDETSDIISFSLTLIRPPDSSSSFETIEKILAFL